MLLKIYGPKQKYFWFLPILSGLISCGGKGSFDQYDQLSSLSSSTIPSGSIIVTSNQNGLGGPGLISVWTPSGALDRVLYDYTEVSTGYASSIVSNSAAATRVVRAARFNPSTEAWMFSRQLDTGVNFFANMSVDYNSSGKLVLAYYDTTAAALKYNYTVDGGQTWGTSTAVVSASGGQGLNLKINPSTGKPAMSFFDRANNIVRYKYCTSALESCTTGGNWANVGSGIVDSTAGVSLLTAAATDGLLNTALTFTSSGLPWIIFPNGSASSTGGLMYSSLSTSTNLFSSVATLVSGSNATTVTPVAATAANFALGGLHPVSVRTSVGSLHTAYYGKGNFLNVTSCGH